MIILVDVNPELIMQKAAELKNSKKDVLLFLSQIYYFIKN